MASIPERQVIMIRNKTPAKVRGSQPPSAIFMRLARKKLTSTMTNMPATAIATARRHFHKSRMARYSRNVVNSMVVDTAVP